jgi:hypothetical protein
MRIACWIPNATNTHSEYVILFAFQQQLWLHERTSMLRYMYMGCTVIFSVGNIPGYVRVLICPVISLLIAVLTLTVVTLHPLIFPEAGLARSVL